MLTNYYCRCADRDLKMSAEVHWPLGDLRPSHLFERLSAPGRLADESSSSGVSVCGRPSSPRGIVVWCREALSRKLVNRETRVPRLFPAACDPEGVSGSATAAGQVIKSWGALRRPATFRGLAFEPKPLDRSVSLRVPSVSCDKGTNGRTSRQGATINRRQVCRRSDE